MFALDRMFALDKVDPEFRILADKLFFTDRTDLDLSKFKDLFESREAHYSYLWDRFTRGVEIFWDETFWANRLDILLSLESKRLETEIGNFLLIRFRRLIDTRYNPDPKLYTEFSQFVAWTQTKALRKEDVQPFREYFISLVHSMQVDRLTYIIGHFIPHLFQDLNEYLSLLGKRVSESARSFEVLRQLESQGVPIDKGPLFKLSSNLLFKRALNRPNRRSFFGLLDDASVIAHLKSEYKPENRSRLIDLIKMCDFKEIEEYHLRNVKNLLELDSSIADELLTSYADSLYARGTGYKGANAKRLVRLCKMFPVFAPKKVLVYLSTHSRMADIKYLISAFPDLKTLIPFV
jgi:hypothetical protein